MWCVCFTRMSLFVLLGDKALSSPWEITTRGLSWEYRLKGPHQPCVQEVCPLSRAWESQATCLLLVVVVLHFCHFSWSWFGVRMLSRFPKITGRFTCNACETAQGKLITASGIVTMLKWSKHSQRNGQPTSTKHGYLQSSVRSFEPVARTWFDEHAPWLVNAV